MRAEEGLKREGKLFRPEMGANAAGRGQPAASGGGGLQAAWQVWNAGCAEGGRAGSQMTPFRGTPRGCDWLRKALREMRASG